MATSPSPKRRKTTRACDACRAQKKRCTGTIPCDSCVRNTKKCTFLASYTRGRAITPPPSSTSMLTPVTPSPSYPPTLTAATSPGQIHIRARSPSHSATCLTGGTPQVYPDKSSATSNENTLTNVEGLSAPQRVVSQQYETSEPASDEVLPDGHYKGPGSAHTWLKQAWSCLGRVRQHVFRLHSTQAASSSITRTDGPIFSHGDRVLKEDKVESATIPELGTETIDLIISTFWDRGLATYRFLHRPTVEGWLHDLRSRKNNQDFPAIRSAIILILLALGSTYLSEADRTRLPKHDLEILQNEVLLYRAQKNLTLERGAPSVESVQARLLRVHYLLSSSRPNQAWYAFGTVVQLVFALGLHQKNYARQNKPGLARELRRRAFWSVYKTDKALSIAHGRPSLIREECITQDLPEMVNDDQVFPDHIAPESDDDCLLIADILQVKLARIIGRSIREYYENDDDALVELIVSNNQRLADWKAQLPPFLSGAIRLSSLIPVLRRQVTILKMFHLHSVIFINRPLLLKSFSESWNMQNDQQIRASINACMSAATDVAKQAVQFNLEGQAFRAFWFSQNMTFNAVSIIYLNSLRLLQGKSSLSEEEYALVSVAEDAQKSLTSASSDNAPGQRYGIVLEQLRLEVRAAIDHNNVVQQNTRPTVNGAARDQGAEMINDMSGNLDWSNLMSETPLNDASMFWPQLDGLPLGFDDWLGTDFVESVLDPAG